MRDVSRLRSVGAVDEGERFWHMGEPSSDLQILCVLYSLGFGSDLQAAVQ